MPSVPFNATAAIILSLGLASLPVAADAQETALTTDQSRGTLFELMAKTIEGEVPSSDFSQFAFKSAFRFPHDATWRNPVSEEDPRSNQAFGIDVSHHTTDACKCMINWSLLADQKVAFAYLKATQGVSSYDKSFKPNAVALKALPAGKKIAVGAYHFLSANGTAADQAANFLKVVGSNLGADDLAPTLDVEWDVRTSNGKVVLDKDGRAKDFWKDADPAGDGKVILARVKAWLDAVKKATGKEPVVYTSQTWWNERMKGVGSIESALPGRRIWISDLSSKGLKVEDPYTYRGKWHLWQFTFTATADGGGLPTGKKVDANVFQGDVPTFVASMK